VPSLSSLAVFLWEFRRRYGAIQQRQNEGGTINIDLIRDMRCTFLASLSKPKKARTTRLYGTSPNQYSHVRLPAHLIGGAGDVVVEYKCVGVSDGYGTFHFSKGTLRMLGMLLGRSNQSRKVNSIFGEGVNPLMRKIRDGLGLLGLPEDDLLKHGSKRLVYGVALASNLLEFLLGMSDSPKYLIPPTRVKHETELIADYWRRRWLSRRIAKPGLLDEVARQTCVYPIRHGAQVEMPGGGEPLLDLWEVPPAIAASR
jgi:hypothetical protein